MGDEPAKRLSRAERTAILDEELVDLVGEGARVQARTPTSAVVEYGERVNHILHLLISVFLCGLWLPVWFFVAMSGGTRLRTLTVDEYGEIHESSPRGFRNSTR